MNSEQRLQNESLSGQQINDSADEGATKSKQSSHTQSKAQQQQSNQLAKQEGQDAGDPKSSLQMEAGGNAESTSKAFQTSTSTAGQPKEKGGGKQQKKNKQKKQAHSKEEGQTSAIVPAATTGGQFANGNPKDTTHEVARTANKSYQSSGHKKDRKGASKYVLASSKQKGPPLGKFPEEEKTSAAQPDSGRKRIGDEDERSVEQSFEDFEVDDEYTHGDAADKAQTMKALNEGQSNYAEEQIFGAKKNKQAAELAESQGSAHKPRKKKAQHEREDASQSTTHFKDSQKNDDFGQHAVASAVAEANLASDQLYHDEGDVPGKAASHHLFSSQHRQADDANMLEDASSRSDCVEESRSTPSSTGAGAAAHGHAKDASRDPTESKTGAADKDNLGQLVTTGSGLKIGQQRSQIIKQKKTRDRRPFQSFGMQSAQSDQAQFVDAIDGVEAGIDVDVGKARALMHTPQSSKSNNQNYSLSAQGAVPLKEQADQDGGVQGPDEDLGEPYYSHGASKDEQTPKKQTGSEHEMKKISTEYVSNMLEKFEVDQHKSNQDGPQSSQGKSNSGKHAAHQGNQASASVPTQPTAGNDDFVTVARPTTKKQKKKKKGKESGQVLLNTPSEEQLVPEATSPAASAAEPSRESTIQASASDAYQVPVATNKTATAEQDTAAANREGGESAVTTSSALPNTKAKQKKAKHGANNALQKRGGRQNNQGSQDAQQEQSNATDAIEPEANESARANKEEGQELEDWQMAEAQHPEPKSQPANPRKQPKAAKADKDQDQGRQRDSESLLQLSLSKNQSVPVVASTAKKPGKSVSMLDPQPSGSHVGDHDQDQHESQNPFEMASALSSNLGESQDLGSRRQSKTELTSSAQTTGEETQQTKRRRRKKQRPGALAHQDAMNQFIKDTHKDQNASRFSTSTTDYHQSKGGPKQMGNKTMGKKNYTRDSFQSKEGGALGGQGAYGGRDSQMGLSSQKKAQSYVQGQHQHGAAGQGHNHGAKVHGSQIFSGGSDLQQVPPLPVYTKKNQSQIQSSSMPNILKKKTGKDGQPVYSGDTEEASSDRGGGATKDAAKKDKESDGTGQGPQARRTSIKQNYFANYYQEKVPVDAGLTDTAFAPAATQVLAYEPLQLQQQYSNAQPGHLQKSKRKGVPKAGQQAGAYSAHSTTGKYGRTEGPPQPAMTEAEQRAATKKEIIEAFEIQNTQQHHHNNPGQSNKKKATQHQNAHKPQVEAAQAQEKISSPAKRTSQDIASDPPSQIREAQDPVDNSGTPQKDEEQTQRQQRWPNIEGADKAVAEISSTATSETKMQQPPAPFQQPATNNHQPYHSNAAQPPLPHPQPVWHLDRNNHPFCMQQQNQSPQATDQKQMKQYHPTQVTSSFLQQSPRHQMPENAMTQNVFGGTGFSNNDGKDGASASTIRNQDLYPTGKRLPHGRAPDEAPPGRESCPLPVALPSAEKSKSQLLPGLAMPPNQAQGRSSVVHHPHHGHQPDLQQPGPQTAPQLHQSMGQPHLYHSSSMVVHGNPNEMIGYPARNEPYRPQSSQYGYPEHQSTNNRSTKKFKPKKHDQVPRAAAAPNQQPYLNYQQEEPYPFGPPPDHIKKDGMGIEELSLQQHPYSYGGPSKRHSDLSYSSMNVPYKGKDKQEGMPSAHQHPQLSTGAFQQSFHAQQPSFTPGGAPSGFNQQAAGGQMFVPKQHQMMPMQAHQGHQRQQQLSGGPQEDMHAKGQAQVQADHRVDMSYRLVPLQGIGSGLIDSADNGGMIMNQAGSKEIIDGQKQAQQEMPGQALPQPQPPCHYQNASGQQTQPQMQGQSGSPQQNFMITSSFGQVGQVQGQIGQINQVNQYNINQYPNLNIASISSNNFGTAPAGSPSPNGASGMQQMPPNFYMPVQGLPNQLHQGLGCMPQKFYPNHPQAPSIPTNLLNTLQASMNALQQQQTAPSQNLQQQQYMNMMAAANSQGQLPQMSGVRYPHHFYDQNLPQTIEYKFYEKFDNDIYDEVNKIQHQLDLTKEERNYILQKLQTFCEQVFVTNAPQGAPGEREEALLTSTGESKANPNKEKGETTALKFQSKQHSTPSPKKVGKIDNSKDHQNKQNLSPRLKQYGSLVTGLALESSDMDMAVTNLYLPDREKMIESLGVFADCLQKWEMIQDLNAISTASIPVIKAIVDLNQLREKEMNHLEDQECQKMKADSTDFGQTQNNLSLEEHNQQIQNQGNAQQISKLKRMEKKIPEQMAKLKIDITFDDNMNQAGEEEYDFSGMMNQGFTPPHYYLTKQSSSISYGGIIEQKTHLGIASCKLIKHYVENYKCLKEVSIVLKQFLARMGLNSPYHGGLSSYSTVLLLVAYMNKWNLKMSPTLTPSRLLMGFLDYYSYYFNVSLFGIDVSNNGSFYEHGSPESNFVILDPLNENNNTTRNSFLTHEIIKSFRKAFNKLKNLLIQYQQQQNVNITDNLLDSILERENEHREVSSDVQTQTTTVQIVQEGVHEENAQKDPSPPKDQDASTGRAIDDKRESSSGGYDSNQSSQNKQTQQTQTDEQIIPLAQTTGPGEGDQAPNVQQNTTQAVSSQQKPQEEAQE